MNEPVLTPTVAARGTARARILVVDRASIGHLICRMLAEDYALEVVPDALTAINRLREDTPDAVIADLDIPGGGLRLTELMAMSPRFQAIPVILTTSHAVPKGVIRARAAGAKDLLVKPFRPQTLRTRLGVILSRAQRQNDPTALGRRVRDKVGTIEGLPTFPKTYAEIVKLSGSPDTTAEEIAAKIEMDPGLLATVFKLANATCFGFRSRVDSIKQAVARLGLGQIADLVMSAQVFDRLGKTQTPEGLDVDRFWRHSVGTAFIARSLAKYVQLEDESAYLGGLLHDVGKVILDQHFSTYYAPVLNSVRETKGDLLETEERLLGVTHTDAGGQLSVIWKLPESIQDAVMYHHQPWRVCRYDRVVCVVHLADVLCNRLGYSAIEDAGAVDIDPIVAKRLAVGSQSLLRLVESAKEDVAESESFLAALGT